MMHKWITHGISILIGLSLLLSGCIFIPIPWELIEQSRVQQEYVNNSGSDVTLVFTYFKVHDEKETPEGILDLYIKDTVLHDTLSLITQEFSIYKEFASGVDRETICRAMFHIDGYDSSRTVRLLVENNVIKEWMGPRNYADSIHSPFNCNSWVFEPLELDTAYVNGKVTFTITDEDLK